MRARNKPVASEAIKNLSTKKLLFEVERGTAERILEVRETNDRKFMVITTESIHIVIH